MHGRSALRSSRRSLWPREACSLMSTTFRLALTLSLTSIGKLLNVTCFSPSSDRIGWKQKMRAASTELIVQTTSLPSRSRQPSPATFCVIPILIDGARLPRASDLPERLKPLVRRNAVEIRHAHFGRDVEALTNKVREAIEHRDNGEKKYYLANLPTRTDLSTLAATIKARWVCEQAHQQLKEEIGLDHFEGRCWQGPHRHALMTMIAYAFLQHRRLAAAKRKKKNPRPTAPANSARRTSRHSRAIRPATTTSMSKLPKMDMQPPAA